MKFNKKKAAPVPVKKSVEVKKAPEVKKAAPPPPVPKAVAPPEVDRCQEPGCSEPLAPGQNQVCAKHIRSS